MILDAIKDHLPQAPEHQVIYRVIQFEPIALSGERLTIAVMAKSATEQKIIQTISDKTLRCMYGQSYGKVKTLIAMVMENAGAHLKSSAPLEQWASPFSGFTALKAQKTRSKDGIDGAIFQAISCFSSLYNGSLINEAVEYVDEPAENLSLTRSVKDIVIHKMPSIRGQWSKNVDVRKNTPIKIDYLGVNYNANFANFNVANLSFAINHAKAKILDMEVLRESRSGGAIANNQAFEVLISTGPDRTPAILDKLNQIEQIADMQQIRVIGLDGPDKIAARIIRSEVA